MAVGWSTGGWIYLDTPVLRNYVNFEDRLEPEGQSIQRVFCADLALYLASSWRRRCTEVRAALSEKGFLRTVASSGMLNWANTSSE